MRNLYTRAVLWLIRPAVERDRSLHGTSLGRLTVEIDATGAPVGVAGAIEKGVERARREAVDAIQASLNRGGSLARAARGCRFGCGRADCTDCKRPK